MSQNINYGETWCEAFKIIADSVLKEVSFDQSIKCTIVDATNSGLGEYRVSNGSTTFLAYSTEKYIENTAVYVLIPQGDYNNRKIILGKVSSSNEDEPYNYIAPYDTFFGVINNTLKNEKGLIANGSVSNLEVGTITINGTTVNTITKDFTRLGVKADFKTLLKGYDCVEGQYGLKIDITCVDESDNMLNDPVKKVIFLTQEDMIGDPYNFQTYYSQEKVFDITGLNTIKEIKVCLCQIAGTFKDFNGSLIPYQDYVDGVTGSTISISENIFVSNIQIDLGYDISAINGDYVQLFTLNSLSYKKDSSSNDKIISLKWLHQDEESKEKYPIDEHSYGIIPYEIRWYRYKFNAEAADEYSGVCWERVPEYIDGVASFSGNGFIYTFTPDSTLESEQIKAVAIYGEKKSNYTAIGIGEITQEKVLKNISSYYSDVGLTTPVSLLDDFDSDKKNNKWLYKMEKDTRVAYTSNILTFTNQDELNPFNPDILNGLTIECVEKDSIGTGTFVPFSGVHLFYNDFGNLIDSSWIKKEYRLSCALNLSSGASVNTEDLDSIKWIFPSDSMITLRDSANNEITADGNIEFKNPTDTNSSSVFYKVKDKFKPELAQTWVKCEAVYKGITYYATQMLYFGYEGTMGSEYSAWITLDWDQPAFTLGEGDVSVPLKFNVYKYPAGNVIDVSKDVAWSLIRVPTSTTTSPSWLNLNKTGDGQYQLKFIDCKDMAYTYGSYVIKAAWTQSHEKPGKRYDIVKYYPISIRTNPEFNATIPNEVLYSTQGIPSFDQVPLQLFKNSELLTVKDGWQFQTNDFQFQVIKDQLIPPIIYSTSSSLQKFDIIDASGTVQNDQFEDLYCSIIFGDCNEYVGQWSSVIIAHQDKYFSSIIDDWTGAGVKISDTGGYILSNMVAAGSKDDKNRFSGVVMGDWCKESADTPQAGLYGFGAGEMAFAFKDDGTAFIGKSGKGRILFDGNKSVIESQSFSMSNTSGMRLDLDNAKIEMKGPKSSDYYVFADYDEYINGVQVINTDKSTLKNGYLMQDEYENITSMDIKLYTYNKTTNKYIESTSYSSTAVYYKKENGRYILIDAEDTNYAIQIGSKNSQKFRVKWDGTLEATGADFDNGFIKGGSFIGGYIGLGVKSDVEKNIDVDTDLKEALDPFISPYTDKNYGISRYVDFYGDKSGKVIANTLTLYGSAGLKLGAVGTTYEGISFTDEDTFNLHKDELYIKNGTKYTPLQSTDSFNSSTTYYIVKKPDNYNFIVNGRSLKFGYNGSGHNFTVDNDGNVKIKGRVEADTGYIGGWSLGKKGSGTAARTVLYSGTNLASANVILDPTREGGIFGPSIKVGNTITKPNLWISTDGALGIGPKTSVTGVNKDSYKFFVGSDGSITLSKDNVTIEALNELNNTLNSYTYTPLIYNATTGKWQSGTTVTGLAAIITSLTSTAASIVTIGNETIDAADVASTAATSISNLASGTYNNPKTGTASTYIDHNIISGPIIHGGNVSGGVINLTGLVRTKYESTTDKDQLSATNVDRKSANLFIWSTAPTIQWDATNEIWTQQENGTLAGFLSYDNLGKGTSEESQNRIWLKSYSALKLQAANGISLDPGSTKDVYCATGLHAGGEGLKTTKIRAASSDSTQKPSDMITLTSSNPATSYMTFLRPALLTNKVHYGTTAPVNGTNPSKFGGIAQTGQIYFQIK